jgi:WD40 repeat protein
VQVGEGNVQIVYSYGGLTSTDGVALPPLASVSGMVASPYRGLGAFEERDAVFFFGREDATEEVLRRMSHASAAGPGVVVVSGASGAGKSSLLRAGMLPRLRGAGLARVPGASLWPCAVFTPGRSPLDELAVRVAALAGTDAVEVRRGLAVGPQGFALTARQAALTRAHGPSAAEDRASPAGGERLLLLVVDQFEQVFTRCDDEAERQGFIGALGAAAAPGPEGVPSALVVLGLRADFEVRCAAYPELAGAIQDRYLLPAMTARQLRVAVTGPATVVNSRVDDELAQVLLAEVRARQTGNPGAGVLPLLSHALDRAWRSKTGTDLTLADYERTGGIEAAVATSAEEAYLRLTAAQQRVARQVFTRLVAVARDEADTADRATRAELTAGKTQDQVADVEAVLEAFATERLLTLAADSVEISHEALLTAWPLLRDTWLAETHADRMVRTRLHDAAADWERRSRDASYLYTGSVLEEAAATMTRISADPVRFPALSPAERDFMRASQRARRRRVRSRQGIVAFLLALVVGLAFATFLAARANQQTAQERDQAVSGQLIAESEELGDTNPVLAKQESLAAWQIDPSQAARYSMLTAARLPGTGVLASSDGAAVNAVAYSPDGKTLATGGSDGNVQLWDVGTQRQVGVLRSSSHESVNSVAFSPDGRIVAAAGGDGIVRMWNVATRQPAGPSLAGDNSIIDSIAFSPHGDLLAAGYYDGTVRLWDRATGQPTGASLAPGAGSVLSVAFSPNGNVLATGSRGGSNDHGTVQLWQVSSRRPIGGPLPEFTGPPPLADDLIAPAVAFSPDGSKLAASDDTGSVIVWNVAKRSWITFLFISGIGTVNSVAFSPDGDFVAAGDNQGQAQLWDLAAEQRIGIPLAAGPFPVKSVAFSPDGKTLATGGNDGSARLWNVGLDDNDLAGSVSAGPDAAQSVAFGPDGKVLATGDYNGTVRLWEAATRRRLVSLRIGGRSHLVAMAFNPNGKTVATGNDDGTVRLWDLATGRQIGRTLTTQGSEVWSVTFSPDGKSLAVGSGDSVVRFWDAATGKQTGSLLTTGAVYSVAFSPDGTLLATGSYNGTAQLWNAATRRPVGHFSTGQDWSVFSVAFSPDGKTLATGNADDTVRLWDVARKQQTGLLSGATDRVYSVAFSPDGQTLAAGSDDGTVRLWDLDTRQQIGGPIASGDDTHIYSVAFSPDGNTLATGYYNGVVQLWDMPYLTNVVSALCASAGGSFTPKQWPSYAQGVPYQKTCP